MKSHSRAMVVSLKNYENIPEFIFLITPPPVPRPLIRHIDCLGKYFEAVNYRNKGVVNFYCLSKYFWRGDLSQWRCGNL